MGRTFVGIACGVVAGATAFAIPYWGTRAAFTSQDTMGLIVLASLVATGGGIIGAIAGGVADILAYLRTALPPRP